MTSGFGTISANVSNISISCSSTTPTFSLASGNYSTPQTITFTSSNCGQIRCTTNGNEPTSNSTIYSTPVDVYHLAGLTLKCKNFKDGVGSDTVTREYSYLSIRTGQTTVYQAGDNGTNQTGVARSYTNNMDGTVTDNYSGLIWQRCSRGLSGATCGIGTATQDTWANQTTYCSGLTLAGRTWRVPTVNELVDLVDSGVSNPSINAAFPATVFNTYWSSTTNATNTALALLVYFSNGVVNNFTKTNNAYVRCISEQENSTQNFVDNNNGTILDKKTGLIWQKCSRSQNNDATCSGTVNNYQWGNSVNS